jgi:hypothetical protein
MTPGIVVHPLGHFRRYIDPGSPLNIGSSPLVVHSIEIIGGRGKCPRLGESGVLPYPNFYD